MKLENFLTNLNNLVANNPELLDHEVYAQDIDSEIYLIDSIHTGHGTSDGFVVEEFYKDPQDWLLEMGREQYNSIQEFINSDENSDMKPMIYFKTSE